MNEAALSNSELSILSITTRFFLFDVDMTLFLPLVMDYALEKKFAIA
jgi:hypothetical protein